MVGAVIDGKINGIFGITNLKEYNEVLRNCEILVLDSNLNEDVLQEAITTIANSEGYKQKKIIYEPVSTSKCNKILKLGLLQELFAIKPNMDELYTMCNFLREQRKKPKLKHSSGIILSKI